MPQPQSDHGDAVAARYRRIAPLYDLVDLPFEESGEVRPLLEAEGLELIALIAPTTGNERAAMILKRASGFVYYISVTGVTGQRATVAVDIAEHMAALRQVTALPIAVGFGISRGEQAAEVARHADAVVVGSAFVKAAEEGRLAECVREIRQGLDGA